MPSVGLAVGLALGAALVLIGYVMRVHHGVCDPENCPSDAAARDGGYLMVVGAVVLLVSLVLLAIRVIRAHRRRPSRGQRARKPTLRDW